MLPIANIDFETYSEAGYYFDETGKRRTITKSGPHGLFAVGASVYTEHPSAEILSLAYDLNDGLGPCLWIPGMALPERLFAHIQNGGLLKAWNSSFEYYAWTNICTARMGWPPLPFNQLRDSMAQARAYSLPGKLEKAAEVLHTTDQKLDTGKKLLALFSIPQQPSKKDPRRRIKPCDSPKEADELYTYNVGDIKTEAGAGALLPELNEFEQQLWLCDQATNFRGCTIDMGVLRACMVIVGQASNTYTQELVALTNGAVGSASEAQKIRKWLAGQSVYIEDLKEDTITDFLKRHELAPHTRRVLEIRQILSSASVKKLNAISRRVSKDRRIRDLFTFCGADRTGRWASLGAQFHNLPKSGPPVVKCSSCGNHSGGPDVGIVVCPWCNSPFIGPVKKAEWSIDAVENALSVIRTGSLQTVERFFGSKNGIAVVVGCLRGLFIATEGYEFTCSDFSAIEAIITAFEAGEEWRMEVFRTHGKIYEMSAAKITGVPFAEFMEHKERTSDHHPLRNKIGKYTELALGFGGWEAAMKRFGADEYLSDEEIVRACFDWREASPMIVKFWGELESCAKNAITYPGSTFTYRRVSYVVENDVLHCNLPSGRRLNYHNPRLVPGLHFEKPCIDIIYMGWKTDGGAPKWVEMKAYGGKLAENYVQAFARDIQAYAMVNLEQHGWPVTLHLHDEDASENPIGSVRLEDFERVMSEMPPFASHMPIRATGGWQGKRYRKG